MFMQWAVSTHTILQILRCLNPPPRHCLHKFASKLPKMSKTMDDIVRIYRDLSKIPEVVSGQISNEDTPGHVKVQSTWKQRDLERSENVNFVKNYLVQLNMAICTPPVEISNVIWDQQSPSGQQRAVVRKVKDKKGDDKEYIEIWSGGNKLHSINATALEKHGKIYGNDGYFGCFEWSSSEGHLLYTAEKKLPKSKSFFEKKKEDDTEKEETSVGDEYVHKEVWGEQMEQKHQPVLCVLDIDTGIVGTIDNLPEDVSPGMASWTPDDSGIVCVGWWNDSYRLGLIYCPIRRSALFHVDFQSAACNIIGSSDQSVRSPVFSPDKSRLVFLENPVGGPHFRCSRLRMVDWATKDVSTVVEIVKKAPADEFQGIYTVALNKRCWSADNRRVMVVTQWRSRQELVAVDTDEKTVTRLSNDEKIGGWTLLDVHKDLLLVCCSSLSVPPYLVLGTLPEKGKESSVSWTKLDQNSNELAEVTWKIVTVDPPENRVNQKYGEMDYEYIWLEPLDKAIRDKAPLIAYPHGGPHSVFSASYMLQFTALCRFGFKVMLINYRGSCGFGQDGIDSLPGNVGTQDVQDCQDAVQKVLSEGLADRNKVVVMGGSHGGFLTTHIIGQYPETYKAAACRNPVTNIASMVGSTDIPDWCYVEGGLPFDHKTLVSPDDYKAFWERSPIRYVHQVKTPLLIMLGADDRRVPPKQGHEFIKALRARGVKCRLQIYPDNCHPINKTECEADSVVNAVRWFKENLPE